ncbi:hypothetical protein HN419_01975 [Candidatus Woesearchaeota archaeon]|jgi:hypothetical protein|nr:hypothetical protein [Candidatus Woesearchaeota archaeon]MBT3537235.1 hypothetical protein [Candidatus Woesearchaeota archaeon]MBT4696789.1 hypothetical protein [Candidatus Woesearchaeota archaeon]MBT7106455.1 hypothetical protein [Candidatus Woesearchaeota archaeon]MBT7931170.1 hypothetical protein [Candidatus Woesearchaeota archaeon]
MISKTLIKAIIIILFVVALIWWLGGDILGISKIADGIFGSFEEEEFSVFDEARLEFSFDLAYMPCDATDCTKALEKVDAHIKTMGEFSASNLLSGEERKESLMFKETAMLLKTEYIPAIELMRKDDKASLTKAAQNFKSLYAKCRSKAANDGCHPRLAAFAAVRHVDIFLKNRNDLTEPIGVAGWTEMAKLKDDAVSLLNNKGEMPPTSLRRTFETIDYCRTIKGCSDYDISESMGRSGFESVMDFFTGYEVASMDDDNEFRMCVPDTCFLYSRYELKVHFERKPGAQVPPSAPKSSAYISKSCFFSLNSGECHNNQDIGVNTHDPDKKHEGEVCAALNQVQCHHINPALLKVNHQLCDWRTGRSAFGYGTWRCQWKWSTGKCMSYQENSLPGDRGYLSCDSSNYY